jgi:hypothetical protein
MAADRLRVMRLVLVSGALLMVGVGVWIFLASDAVLGAILAGVGLVDLVTIPWVLGRIEAGRAAAGAEPLGEDPAANPYAKED